MTRNNSSSLNLKYIVVNDYAEKNEKPILVTEDCDTAVKLLKDLKAKGEPVVLHVIL
jgi:protein-tyrosine phosphatase